jgi:signal transduction histidine kinase
LVYPASWEDRTETAQQYCKAFPVENAWIKFFSNTSTVRKGIGILNIKNREELFHGKVEILSESGKGCRLTVSFPLIAGKVK